MKDKLCDNPCRDFIMGGCGQPSCHSYCHQDSEFYKKYDTLEKLKQREKAIVKEMAKENKRYEIRLLKKLYKKYTRKKLNLV